MITVTTETINDPHVKIVINRRGDERTVNDEIIETDLRTVAFKLINMK